MSIPLTDAMRADYQSLFDSCQIAATHQNEVDSLVDRIVQDKSRYRAVGDPLNIPWYFISIVHCMECSLKFGCHLHNGDPLTARTVHVPIGRPLAGDPAFTWEESATDALTLRQLNQASGWTVPDILYRLEGYNGYGYRNVHPAINTPYLWSYSNSYTSGKYVSDGKYDPNAVSQQCGAAAILRRMLDRGVIQVDTATATPLPIADAALLDQTI